jgi:hypothetical protein
METPLHKLLHGFQEVSTASLDFRILENVLGLFCLEGKRSVPWMGNALVEYPNKVFRVRLDAPILVLTYHQNEEMWFILLAMTDTSELKTTYVPLMGEIYLSPRPSDFMLQITDTRLTPFSINLVSGIYEKFPERLEIPKEYLEPLIQWFQTEIIERK